MITEPVRGRKILNILSDLAEKNKVCDTHKKRQKWERVTEIKESWKSYTCFSADYLKITLEFISTC